MPLFYLEWYSSDHMVHTPELQHELYSYFSTLKILCNEVTEDL